MCSNKSSRRTNGQDDSVALGENATVAIVVADVNIAVEADGTDVEQWTIVSYQHVASEEVTQNGMLHKPRLAQCHA